ncbi:MAG: Uma2 family endonuclease [Polyangiaceae bacterium]|nr:Uma2 family endonuclease [Polyangiaceae bacterium]
MTDEEWANLPEDEEGELVDGVLVEEEVPDWLHEVAVGWLIATLRSWAVPRGGLVGGSELKYVLRKGRGRKPDVSMILPGQKRPPLRGALRKPADVLIEVVSPRPRDVRRDRIEKLGEYAAFGARYYWLLDPTMRTFEIFELNAEGRYVRALGAEAGKLEPIPGCEGLVLDLDELWAEIDQWGAEAEEDDAERE